MVIKKMAEDGRLLLELEGRLDAVTAPELEQVIVNDLHTVEELIMDFGQLIYVSSAGLRVILAAQKKMNRQGSMVIRHVREAVMDVLEVTGFTDILEIEPDMGGDENVTGRVSGRGAASMDDRQISNIAVVCGGTSAERDASMANGKRIDATLSDLGYAVDFLEFDAHIVDNLTKTKPDCVFLCAQGKGHGDGTLQSICDRLGIPYTGSKAEASALINHKRLCKERCLAEGILTPRYRSLKQTEYAAMDDQALREFLNHPGYPCVAKGVSQGGSCGIELLQSEDDLCKLEKLYDYDDELLFEQFIPGRFLTVSLLQLQLGAPVQALPILEGKNIGEGSIILFNRPFTAEKADISEELSRKLAGDSIKLFYAFGAAAYARVDFMLDHQNTPYFLEINAVPGMREGSFYPMAAELAGISFPQLVEILIKNR